MINEPRIDSKGQINIVLLIGDIYFVLACDITGVNRIVGEN